MTENETKEMLQAKLTCMNLEDLSCIEKGCSRNCNDCEYNYAQGTSGEQKEALSIAIKALEKIQQYRSIGTVEECREARERQTGKKPILCMNEVSGMFVDYADGHGEYKTQMNNWWRCPCCNEVVGQRVIVYKHIHDQRKKKYCEKCGQAIDWPESARLFEEEGAME